MINRILIRIKVVQLLYSYLLTQTDFRIEQEPDGASNDKKFAYAAYLNLMLLILEICGLSTRPQAGKGSVTADRKLANGKLAKALAADPTVRRIILRNSTDIDALRPVAQHLHDTIVASAVYREYHRKRKAELAEEVNMWIAVVETIFAKDPVLDKAMRALDGYSNVGYRRAVMQLANTLRSFYGASASYVQAYNALKESLDKAYELYLSIFVLITELTREQEARLETAMTKHLATSEERNPNRRFVDNRLAARLAESPALQALLKEHPVSWDTDFSLINRLLSEITSSQIYRDYMDAPESSFEADCEFWRDILRSVIFPGDALSEALEDKSIFWNDDLQTMGTFVLKTIRNAEQAEGEDISFFPQYKDEEDAKFGAELFTDAVDHREDYRALVEKFINTGNWDPDRLAFMDIVILTVAIAELKNYPNIPVVVTMNEYIEIANNYSTANSGQFINGVLSSIARDLRESGEIAK